MGATIPLVTWHEGERAIVFLQPDGTVALGVKAEALRAMGYAGDDAGYRRSLPRLDPSPLATRLH